MELRNEEVVLNAEPENVEAEGVNVEPTMDPTVTPKFNVKKGLWIAGGIATGLALIGLGIWGGRKIYKKVRGKFARNAEQDADEAEDANEESEEK